MKNGRRTQGPPPVFYGMLSPGCTVNGGQVRRAQALHVPNAAAAHGGTKMRKHEGEQEARAVFCVNEPFLAQIEEGAV